MGMVYGGGGGIVGFREGGGSVILGEGYGLS